MTWQKALQLVFILLLILSPGMLYAQEESATPEPDVARYVFDWPLAMPTSTQLMEAVDCGRYAGNEYPDHIIDLTTFEPESACDWAGVAIAHAMIAQRDSLDDLPDEAFTAFYTALELNPAMAFIEGMLYGYLGAVRDLVAPPDVAGQPVKSLTIQHLWNGVGDLEFSWLEYEIEVMVDEATGAATATGYYIQGSDNGRVAIDTAVDAELVQAMGAAALQDLIPMEEQFHWLLCYDIYPTWHVRVVYEDGSYFWLTNNGSNLMFYGAPWQVTIDDQPYTQISTAFLDALTELIDALELPWGETAASVCPAGSDPPLQLAFPLALTPAQ